VEKALLFSNWSSFSRQTQSPYVSNSCGFSLPLGGGGGRGSAGGFSRADRYSRQFLSTRPGRPVRQERRVGLQRGSPGRTGTVGSSLARAPAGRYGKESRAGQYRRAQGQVGMRGRGDCTYYYQNVYSFLYPVLQNIYMDKRVLGTLGIKLQICCIGRQEN
jgi:hypothetical protein